jgi:hypothetical protein
LANPGKPNGYWLFDLAAHRASLLARPCWRSLPAERVRKRR